MKLVAILPTYIFWHYTRAIRDYIHISANFIWFIFYFFSIEILLKTLTDPWKRLSRDETAHPTFFGNLVINILMRLVGISIRLATIALGLLSLIVVFSLLLLGFFVWLILPFIVAGSFLNGVGYFFI